ncbi:MAG TPA: hypothetical protein ENO23_01540, partial [Alphaproteobacteria bacterium]|nr:hypothetical protein [Alphaproteobacteria bacterium]
MTSRGNHRGTGSTLSDADIIERFGGIRPMAAKLGVAVTTVQGWKNRGHIPENRHDEIRAAAARHGIDLGEAGSGPEAPRPEESRPGTRGPAEPQPEAAPGPASAAEFPHRSRTAAAGPAADQEPGAAPAAPPPAGRAAMLGPAWAAFALAALVAVALLTRPLWEPSLYPDAGAGAADGGDAQALRELEAATRSQYE